MKISIIGHCGSGKTTLARAISNKLNIPRLELDRLFFNNGGAGTKNVTEKNVVKEKIKVSVIEFMEANPSWVIDGVYLTSVQPYIIEQVDTIVFIDIPLIIRMYNHLKRWWKNEHRHHEVSRFKDLLFTFDMIRRHINTQPKINKIIKDHPSKILVLKNYVSVGEYLKKLSGV